MLSSMRLTQNCANSPIKVVDDRWDRNMKEDMKTAMDLLWEFRTALDRLHPECVTILERMLQIPSYR